MNRKRMKSMDVKLIDLIPALSGLIGKTALVTSFAVIWAKELNITTPGFLFENVRLEMIIGGLITLIAAAFYSNVAPSGTLAPLIVLVPSMAAFGVHPFILSLTVGIFGIISIKTKLFHYLLSLSGQVSKTSLTLTFGVSGILLSAKNLIAYFGDKYIPLIILSFILITAFVLLMKLKKTWLIIPVAASVSLLLPIAFGMGFPSAPHTLYPKLDPSFWWNEMWGIGFGFDLITILKTLPFAMFVVLLWAIDTISITALLDANKKAGVQNEDMDLNRSFIIAAIRNIVGGFFGGAQTSALWRSFLIPLFMIRRPLRAASILMGSFGVIFGFFAIPIKILSYPPLIWSVLLFGIFLPLGMVGFNNYKNEEKLSHKIAILMLLAIGEFFSPILTWIGAIFFEKVIERKRRA